MPKRSNSPTDERERLATCLRGALRLIAATVGRLKPQVGRQTGAALFMDRYGTDGGGLIVTIVRGPSALGKMAKGAELNLHTGALASKARDTKGDVIYDTLPGIGDGAFVIGSGASLGKAFTSTCSPSSRATYG